MKMGIQSRVCPKDGWLDSRLRRNDDLVGISKPLPSLAAPSSAASAETPSENDCPNSGAQSFSSFWGYCDRRILDNSKRNPPTFPPMPKKLDAIRSNHR